MYIVCLQYENLLILSFFLKTNEWNNITLKVGIAQNINEGTGGQGCDFKQEDCRRRNFCKFIVEIQGFQAFLWKSKVFKVFDLKYQNSRFSRLAGRPGERCSGEIVTFAHGPNLNAILYLNWAKFAYYYYRITIRRRKHLLVETQKLGGVCLYSNARWLVCLFVCL